MAEFVDMPDNVVQPEYVVMAPTSSCIPDPLSLIKVKDSSLQLDPDEEFSRYGYLKKDREEAIRSIEITHGWAAVHSICDPELPPQLDYVWNGWQAAYLSLKRDGYGAEPSDFQHVQTADKIDSRKRKHGETLAYEGSQEISCQIMHVKAVIVVSLASAALLAYKDWLELESVVGKIESDTVQKNMFDCFAKFVLSILDDEDMERMFFSAQLQDENEKFFSEICKKGLFEDFVSGKLGSNQFPHMTEGDFYEAFLAFKLRRFKPLRIKVIPEEVKHSELTDKFWIRALQLVEEHRPLKMELIAQVLMEHSCMKGFHVTDILILEAVRSLSLPELSKKYVARLSVEDAEKLSRLLGDLAQTMFQMTCELSLTKAEQAVAAECSVLRPVMGMFCSFRSEVEDVLRIANYERRMENKRFITLSHILTGLRCTRVSAFVPKNLKVASVVTSSKFSVYKLSELTTDMMRFLGDFLAGLVHVVLAIVFGSFKGVAYSIFQGHSGEYIERLEACQTGPEQKLKSIDVFTTILERRCRAKHVLKLNVSELIVKLDKDLKSGRIVLPQDDDLRV